MQEEKEKLLKDKEELTTKLRYMQKGIKRLQAKSCALDGLATLAEATSRI